MRGNCRARNCAREHVDLPHHSCRGCCRQFAVNVCRADQEGRQCRFQHHEDCRVMTQALLGELGVDPENVFRSTVAPRSTSPMAGGQRAFGLAPARASTPGPTARAQPPQTFATPSQRPTNPFASPLPTNSAFASPLPTSSAFASPLPTDSADFSSQPQTASVFANRKGQRSPHAAIQPQLLLDFLAVARLREGGLPLRTSPLRGQLPELLHALLERLDKQRAFPFRDLRLFTDTRLSKSPRVDECAAAYVKTARGRNKQAAAFALADLIDALEPGELVRWLHYLPLPSELEVGAHVQLLLAEPQTTQKMLDAYLARDGQIRQ